MPRRSERGGCNCNNKHPNGIQKTKNFDKNKQSKALQTRLMQISLTADAHIYQAKKVSTEKAREFLQEVSTLKDQCTGDIRALQVIEKLTSIMKMIIQEGTACEINDDPIEILKDEEDPLAIEQCAQNDYSMTEVPQIMSPILQCKTQLHPHEVENNYKINLTKEINNNNDTVLIDLTENEFLQPIDLTEPNDDLNQKHPKISETSNVLTKAISNLSLDDIERQKGVNVDHYINSQSILDDFEVQIIKNTIDKNVKINQHKMNTLEAQFDYNDIQSQSILDDNEINEIQKSIENNSVRSQLSNTNNEPLADSIKTNNMIGCSESNTIVKNKTVNSNIHNIINHTKEYRSTEQILPKSIRKPRTRKDTDKAKPKRSYNRKANVSRSNINLSTNIEVVGFESNTNYLKCNLKDTSINNTKTRKERTKKKDMIGKMSGVKLLDTNINVTGTNLATDTVITNTGNFMNSCTNKVTNNIEDNTNNEYSNNTAINTNMIEKINNVKSYEEDLSWIENIKYIRVVEKAEFCSLEGIADSFWDNVCYPDDFDEEDYKF